MAPRNARGALLIGEVLGQSLRMLCWYQRIVLFPFVPLVRLRARDRTAAAASTTYSPMIRRTFMLGAVALTAATLAHNNRGRSDGPSSFGATHTSAGSPLVRPDVPCEGSPYARITLVEFLDPAGEASRAFHPIVREIREKYPDDVHLVQRYASFHAASREGLRILEAAHRQDLFGPVLEALYEAQPAWAGHDRTQLFDAWDVAAAAGLDVERGRHVAQAPEVEAHLAREQSDVVTLGIARAPTFFMNGRRVTLSKPISLVSTVRTRLESRAA